MAVELDPIIQRIEGDIADLRRELNEAGKLTERYRDRAKRALKQVGTQLLSVSKNLVSLRSGLALVAGAAGLFLFTKRSAAAGDSIAKTADRVGIFTEDLQELQFVASRTGINLQLFNTALTALIRRSGEAIRGNKGYRDAFEALNITIEQLRTAKPAELLNLVADGVKNLGSQAEQIAALDRVMSEAGRRLFNFTNLGSKGINNLRQSARTLGIVVKDEVLRSMELATDQIGDMEAVMASSKIVIAKELLPVLKELTELFTDPEFKEGIKSFAVDLKNTLEFIVTNADTIKVVAAALAGLSIGARVGPLGAIGGLLVGSAAGAAFFREAPSQIQLIDAELSQLQNRLNDPNFQSEAGDRKLLVLRRRIEGLQGLRDVLVALSQTPIKTPDLSPKDPEDGGGGASTTAAADIASIKAVRTALNFELEQLKRTTTEQQLYNMAKQSGVKDIEEFVRELRPLVEELDNQTRAIEEQERASEETKAAITEFGLSASSAFEDAIIQGAKFRDILKGIRDDLLRLAIRKFVTEKLFGSFLNVISSSKGNVFSGGHLQKFARGGVTSGTVTFPTAKGIGIAGEAGIEGIFPLKRNSRGDLGVQADISQGSQRPVIGVLELHNHFDVGLESVEERINALTPGISESVTIGVQTALGRSEHA